MAGHPSAGTLAGVTSGKGALRRRMRAARAALGEREQRAARALAHLDSLAAYQQARTVMWYVSFGDEIDTHVALARCARSKEVVIPFCYPTRIGLWRFGGFDELTPSTFGVLEPAPARREDPDHAVDPRGIDVVVVPGLAFDRAGGRLGFGKGYYDRFLAQLAPSTLRVGYAFAEQMIDAVPTEGHDVPMHTVVTDREVWEVEGSG